MPPLSALFVLDPPERLDPATDTSLALIDESLKRGHRVFACTLEDLRLVGRDPRGSLQPVTAGENEEMYRAGAPRDCLLADMDVIWMRKDPPVDETYLQGAMILGHLPGRILQVNAPKALRNHGEKIIPLYFPGMAPESLISSNPSDLRAFLEEHGRIVVKPLNDCSGRGIFALTAGSENPAPAFSQATDGGRRFVLAQRFLPEIVRGDKRVLLLGGEILGYLRRVPRNGDFRSNVNAGGHCVPCELTPEDRAICSRLAPWLVREGIHLAGVDIVGSHVLEVNITSPSCLREMNELGHVHLEERVLDYIEKSCRN